MKGSSKHDGRWTVVFFLKITKLAIKLSAMEHACGLQLRKLKQKSCNSKFILSYIETLPGKK